MRELQGNVQKDEVTVDDVVPTDGPPEPNRPSVGKWERKLAKVMQNPGQWFIVQRGPNAVATANNLRRRSVRIPRPDHEWEFVARTVDGEGRVYARYLGERHPR